MVMALVVAWMLVAWAVACLVMAVLAWLAWVVWAAVVAWLVVSVVEVAAVADLLNSSERGTKDRRAASQFITT